MFTMIISLNLCTKKTCNSNHFRRHNLEHTARAVRHVRYSSHRRPWGRSHHFANNCKNELGTKQTAGCCHCYNQTVWHCYNPPSHGPKISHHCAMPLLTVPSNCHRPALSGCSDFLTTTLRQRWSGKKMRIHC